MTSISINYYTLLKASMLFLLIGNLARSISPVIAALFEFSLIALMLFFTIIYLAQTKTTFSNNELIYYSFLLYLILHLVAASIFRPIELQLSFYDIFYYNLSEFRLSTLGYLLPLIFIPIYYKNKINFEIFLVGLIKFAILYTIFEQVFSLLGFRYLFEIGYANSGVVSDNLIGLKSLGMYRVWGLIGSPQLLGIFHVITLVYLLDKKEKFWSILCIIAIIASTSKSAYIILLFYAFIYMIQKKHFLTLMFSLILMIIISVATISFYSYIMDLHLESDYPNFTKFIGSIYGYFILLTSVAEVSAAERFITGGALNDFLLYFSANPENILAGKGITYSIFLDTSSIIYSNYFYLTSDYYFLTFVEQYGLIGFIFALFIFLIYPFAKILTTDKLYYAVPIIFFLSMMHYPPNISKLFMVFMAYSLYKVYLSEDHVDEK
jgi:hypothetical protein